MDDLAVDIRQAEITPGVLIRQSFVIEPEQMQDRGAGLWIK